MTTAVIASGQTVSSAVDLSVFNDIGRQRANAIVFPSTWVNGTLTFQASVDGGTTYQTINLPGGAAYSVTANAGTFTVLDLGVFGQISNFRVVSSVTQTSNVSLQIIVVDADKATALGGELSSGGGGGGGSVSGTVGLSAGTANVGTFSQSLAGSIVSGSVSVATSNSAVPLGTATLANGVTLIAPTGATAVAYIGGISVTTATGFPLYPGATISLPVASLSEVYINGTSGVSAYYIGA